MKLFQTSFWYKALGFVLLMGVATACTDLNIQPKSELTPDVVFSDPGSYEAFLAKLYAGLATTGQQGPAGAGDIGGIDEGFSNYLRQYFQLQELPTETAIIAWNDEGVRDFQRHDWTAANQFVAAMFYRIFYQISLSSEFLRQTSEVELDRREESDEVKAEVATYRAEARLLRALSYWHAIDLFGNVPLIDENEPIGLEGPEQSDRATVFAFVESELLAIENQLLPPGEAPYGRMDRASAWMVLAKLYLNSEVYGQGNRYGDCLDYCNRIIESGAYSLHDAYNELFMADNGTNANSEFIFAVPFDAQTQTWGGMTYLTHATVGGSMPAATYGIDGGWGGVRTTPEFVALFGDTTSAGNWADNRALFYTDGQTLEIQSEGQFGQGYSNFKYVNITSDSVAGANPTHPDTDFPMFRLADVYLMYAECVLRGGGGSSATALGYVNQIRERAFGDASNNITEAEMNLDFILAERGRELYWECHRRTDRIRFNEFTVNGTWAFKGGVPEGRPTEAFRDLYPIPADELIANPKLQQNEGY